jgi:hypothetical protein
LIQNVRSDPMGALAPLGKRKKEGIRGAPANPPASPLLRGEVDERTARTEPLGQETAQFIHIREKPADPQVLFGRHRARGTPPAAMVRLCHSFSLNGFSRQGSVSGDRDGRAWIYAEIRRGRLRPDAESYGRNSLTESIESQERAILTLIHRKEW